MYKRILAFLTIVGGLSLFLGFASQKITFHPTGLVSTPQVLASSVPTETNFEDSTYQRTLYNQPSQSTPSQPAGGNSVTTIYTYPVYFSVETATIAKYPDYQSRINSAVANINSRLTSAGINRQWSVSGFGTYQKTTVTGCRASNPEGGYLPTLYCNHPSTYVFVAADETVDLHNYSSPSAPSVEWHGYNGMFDSQGVSVLGHELGHVLGLPDEYNLEIKTENNLVNGQAYNPFDGYIMHNLTPGIFSVYDTTMVNHNSTTLPIPFNTWVNYQPAYNVIRLVSSNGQKVVNANVYVYTSNPALVRGGLIDTTPEYTGTTGAIGTMNLGGNILGSDGFYAIKAFLIKVVFQNHTYYYWMNFTDVNLAYLNGYTQTAYYQFVLPITLPTPPTCRPDYWSCYNGLDCCSQNCVFGTCQPGSPGGDT